jgi:L-rhamnose isomerase
MKHFKKQQHINGLHHDLDFFNAAIAENKVMTWFMGDRLTRQQLKVRKQELEGELLMIETDKNYKPWN